MSVQARWQQRFENYRKALKQFIWAVDNYQDTQEDLIKEGIIQRFEFTHELAWKTLKDFMEYEGHQDINGSRSATRKAFNLGLLTNGHVWMAMIESRNRTVHAYDPSVLETEFSQICKNYKAEFLQLESKLGELM